MRTWRRPKREVLVDPRVMDQVWSAPEAEEESDQDELRHLKERQSQMRLVRRALKKADPHDALLIRLYFLDGQRHSYRSISQWTGSGNPGTAHREIKKAIRNLKVIIRGDK